MNVASPAFSVVVAPTSGRVFDLARCLRAWHEQTPPIALDLVVPYDDRHAEITRISGDFPAVRFVRLEHPDAPELGGRHGPERLHALRAAGLRAAVGDIVVLTEDHAYVERTWAAEMTAAMTRHPAAAAIGGPIECATRQGLAWIVWLCDFWRYQKPLPDRRSRFLSDTNVAYHRSALALVADTWRRSYHETEVHEAMISAGLELRTIPLAASWQARRGLTILLALRERFTWGRSFGGTRARMLGSSRVVFACGAPLLPVVRLGRLVGTTTARGRLTARLLAGLPVMVLLELAWAAGELAGYVTGRAE